MANSDAEVIKEFLVSIGVKVDTGAISKFDGIIGTIGKGAFRFATILTTAAIGIETFVTTVADRMEDLYWASQRLHDSVSNIQDYALGIQNLGGTAEGARDSLENLMRLLRTNPGYGGLLASLGIDPRQGGTQIMEGLRRRFQRMPYFMAAQYAGMFGIDETTLQAMMRSRGPVGSGVYRGLYKSLGMDPDKAAKAAHDFMIQIRDLGAQFTVIAQAMAYDLLPVAKKFTVWIAGFLKNTALPWLKNLTPEKVEYWVNQFDQILVKLGVIIDGLAKIIGWFAGEPAKPNLTKPTGSGQPGDQVEIPKWVRGTWITSLLGNALSRKNLQSYYEKQGWTREQAAGIVANLMYESGLNPKKPGDSGKAYGLAQWHPDRQANFQKVFGHPIQQGTPEEQAAFVQWELTHTEKRAAMALRAAKTAADAALAMSRFYERPQNVAASAAARSSIAREMAQVQIHQKTDIHVNAPHSNPHEVAGKVAGQQSRVNGDLIRNLKPALQ